MLNACAKAIYNPDFQNGCESTNWNLSDIPSFVETNIELIPDTPSNPSTPFPDRDKGLFVIPLKTIMHFTCRTCDNKWSTQYGQLALIFDPRKMG